MSFDFEISRVDSFTGYCTYKGKQYNQGQRWDDGCQYNCACENGATGFYRCIEK